MLWQYFYAASPPFNALLNSHIYVSIKDLRYKPAWNLNSHGQPIYEQSATGMMTSKKWDKRTETGVIYFTYNIKH